MRRRRSRLPLIVLGAIAILLGATAGMMASNVGPGGQLLALLNGSSASASPGATAIEVGDAGNPSTAPSAAATGESAPPSQSPTASADSGSSGSGGPTASATTSATASAGASSKPGASGAAPSPSSVGPVVASAGGEARPVYNGSRAKKVVALTFDDGYSPVALRQLLAILNREHVAATFFPYGWAVAQDPAGWHMVVADGYPIGNHTLTHATLTTLTPAQVTEEMVHGRRTIDLYSGGKSIDLMRPPGGAFNTKTAKAIAAAGYQTMVMWDVDTFDWQGPSAATILARAIRGTNGSIVLMHAGPLNTPKALPAIIANYRKRGFTFVTVPELLAAR